MIRANCKVLIKMPSENCKIVHLRDQAVSLGKFGSFLPSALVGQPWNAVYEILPDKSLRIVDHIEEDDDDIPIDPEEDVNNDNSNLVDAGKESQKLSGEDIERLKAEKNKGEIDSTTVIKQIVENNTTFQGKTSFAKQKYVRRKERKYSKKFEALEPTARNLCEHYFNTKPQKIRVDTLAQMLCLGNVMATSKLLVSDSVGGILVGSLLERMVLDDKDFGGRIFAVTDGDQTNFDVVKDMNIAEEVVDRCLDWLPWSRITETPQEVKPETEDPKLLERYERKVAAIAKTKETRSKLVDASFDGLFLATQFDVQEAVEKLIQYVGWSRPIVIYSPFKEMLIPTFLKMRADPQFVNAQLSETMTREYQVPVSGLGTHPHMQTSGTGGFILTATRVKADDSSGVLAPKSTVVSKSNSKKRRKL